MKTIVSDQTLFALKGALEECLLNYYKINIFTARKRCSHRSHDRGSGSGISASRGSLHPGEEVGQTNLG